MQQQQQRIMQQHSFANHETALFRKSCNSRTLRPAAAVHRAAAHRAAAHYATSMYHAAVFSVQ